MSDPSQPRGGDEPPEGDVDPEVAELARLLASGVNVSEVRAGRRPGTRGLSVRDGTCGIHTLLVEKTARA